MPKSLKNLHVFKLIWFIPVYKSFNFGYIYPVILDLHYHKWDKDLAAFFFPRLFKQKLFYLPSAWDRSQSDLI